MIKPTKRADSAVIEYHLHTEGEEPVKVGEMTLVYNADKTRVERPIFIEVWKDGETVEIESLDKPVGEVRATIVHYLKQHYPGEAIAEQENL